MSSTATLHQRAARGAAWVLTTGMGARVAGLIGTLLLARYLAPDEYGVVMAASIAATTASSVTTFGVGIYLVSTPRLSRAETFHASCWFLVTGAAALLATLLLGGALERWSGAPGLSEFLPVLLLATLLERIAYLPERMLARNLRFKPLSLARAAGELTYTVVSVVLVAHGAGAMAIAWGSLARSMVRFAGIVPAVDIREWLEPQRLRLETLVSVIGYGLSVTVASIATFGVRRWDNLLISRYFGPGLMGAYNYAYNLADTPATAAGDQIGEIIAASFPHVDRRKRADALVRACTLVAMVMFPLSIGLAAIAPTVVETFFDPRWADVGTMLMYLSALSTARPIGGILASYFYAERRPTLVVWLEWGSLIGILGLVSTVGRAGIPWACASVSAVFVLRVLAGMWLVRQQDGIALSEFLLPMTRPLAAGVVMALGVAATRFACGAISPAARLPIEVAAGATIYVVAALLIARRSCQELLRVVHSALGNGSTQAPDAAAAGDTRLRVLSLSTEFPNRLEPAKGLFVRSRLAAIASRTRLLVVAPVATLDYANPHRNLFAARGIPRRRVEGRLQVLHPRWLYPPKGGWMNAFFLAVRLAPALVRLRARRSFDVIDAHFAHPEGIAAVLLGRMFRRPVIVTVRGVELRYQHQRVKRFFMSWALRRADRVIAVSDGLRDLAVGLGADPARVRTVPNGIDADVFFRRDRVTCRSRHRIGPTERIILTAGDLAELKGHHRAIAAVKGLNDRGMRTRLLIAGGVGRSGRYADALRHQVTANRLADQVTFLGEVTQQTLAELMSAADVFCLASSTEGWPNVVNEALACGTPVVATDVGAVRQMLVSDRFGSVVRVDDVAALTDALSAAVAAHWHHDEISAWGRSRSWRQVAEDVLAEMHAAVAEQSGPRGEAAGSGVGAAPARTPRFSFLRMGRA